MTDSSSPTATKLLTITLYDDLQITSSSTLPVALVSSTYGTTLAATGGDGNYTWSNPTTDLPGWLNLNPSTGEVENLEVLFFSTRLLRQDLFELPVSADLRLAA